MTRLERVLLAIVVCIAFASTAWSVFAQTPCTLPPGDVTFPPGVTNCPANTYTWQGGTFTPKPTTPPDPIPPTEGNAIDQCAAGSFCRLAGTKITDLPLPTTPPGNRAYITAYSGAAYDTKRNCLLVTGGGHNDYGGNEVVSLCIGEATLKWKLVAPPSPVIPPQQNACNSYGGTYADGKPASRHNYTGLTYLPDQDVLMELGGLKWCAAGDAVYPTDAWWLGIATGQWTRKADPPLATGQSLKSVYDATTKAVYVNCNSGECTLKKYTPATETWTTLGGSTAYPAFHAAIDPKRALMVYLGYGSGPNAWIGTQPLTGGPMTTRTLTGDVLPAAASTGGMAYDPVTGLMVVWGGGTNVYEIDLTANSSKKIQATGAIPGNTPDSGTYGRWAYAPAKDAFLLVQSGSVEAFVYKPVRGSTPPQPPSTFSMTVQTAGTGHGTVGGAGSYAAGATVPLTATPDASSDFTAWAPSECANNPYTMPPRAVTCTASFAPKPTTPPTSGGPVALVRGSFVNIKAPAAGGPSTGSKHVTFAPRPGSQLVYGMGGDYQAANTSAPDSYRQELWTFNLTAALQGDSERGWRLIQTYCQASTSGGVQPKSPDYQGWVWDSLRNGWWSVPGTSFIPGLTICPGRTAAEQDDQQFKYRHLMLYKPDEPDLAKRWVDWDPAFDPNQTYANWQSIHDATDDKIIGFIHSGGNGGGIRIYRPATKTMTYKWLESSATGNLRLEVSLPCHDVPNRVAYYGDPYNNKFYKLDIKTETITRLADVPGPSMSSNDPYVLNAWRPSARECWLWNKADRSLWVFSAATGTWRQEVYSQVPAAPPNVNVTNAITWDPTNDVLLFLGTNAPGAGMGVWAYQPLAAAVTKKPVKAKAPASKK